MRNVNGKVMLAIIDNETADNNHRGGILVPRRFVRKYTRLIKRAGFTVTKVIADPNVKGEPVPYQVRGHQLLLISGVKDPVKLVFLCRKWESFLDNEN